MEYLFQVLVFASQTLVVFLFIAAVILLIALVVFKAQKHGELQIERLDEKIDSFGLQVQLATLDKEKSKELLKARKKEKDDHKKQTLYVLDFKGDVKAQAVDQLREEISALLTTAHKTDEVLLRLESPGGVVHGYGLAAAQLERIKNAGLKLTIAVDKVAASGGYLMACNANKIIAAPFAILGSIGVVAQVPNLNRLLKKYDVDFKEYTAGDYKRTVSLLGEINEKGEQKFKEQLEDTHLLFKNYVKAQRPQLDIDRVATGEHWYGTQALQLGLIDQIGTSDDYLLSSYKNSKIVQLKFEKKQSLSDKLSGFMGKIFQKSLDEIHNQTFDSYR